MSAAEVIREARNVLFERGWGQGDLRNADGSLCVRGAIAQAAYGVAHDERGYSHPATSAVAKALGSGFIAVWNDTPGRTFADVIDVLDRAEKIAEEGEVSA